MLFELKMPYDVKFIAAALLEGHDLQKITKDKFVDLYYDALIIESSLLAAVSASAATAAVTPDAS